MKQLKVILTPEQRKIIDAKFKEARLLKEIRTEIENYSKKYKKQVTNGIIYLCRWCF